MMSLSKNRDADASHFLDYKSFRAYMRKEAYWTQLNSEAWLLIKKMEVEGPALPSTFEAYFKNQRRLHVLQAFVAILGDIKSVNDADKMPELLATTKRLVYRCVYIYDVIFLHIVYDIYLKYNLFLLDGCAAVNLKILFMNILRLRKNGRVWMMKIPCSLPQLEQEVSRNGSVRCVLGG